MRKILFRGKRKDVDWWEVGDYSACTTSDGAHHSFINGTGYEVYPETVGQYTGLNDVNGTMIFEGDIVQLFESVKETFGIIDSFGVVRFMRGGFYVNEADCLYSLNTLASYDWIFRGKVVGNIYDNPELLEGGN